MKRSIFKTNIASTVLIITFSIIVFYSWPKFAFCEECSVDMVIYDKELHNEYTLSDFLRNKTFYRYEFTGNNKVDKDIFKHYRNAVHLLSNSNDTINGIRFKFNKSTNYQRFVDVFDVCYIEDVNFIYDNDDLWIVNKSIANRKNRQLFYGTWYSSNKISLLLTHAKMQLPNLFLPEDFLHELYLSWPKVLSSL